MDNNQKIAEITRLRVVAKAAVQVRDCTRASETRVWEELREALEAAGYGPDVKCQHCKDTGYEWGLDGRDGPCRHCDAPRTDER